MDLKNITFLNSIEVKEFINSIKEEEKYDNELLEAILSFLPFLSNYREEGNEFSFKIALGRKDEINCFKFTELKTLEAEKNQSIGRNTIENALKDVVVFCRRGCDVAIIESFGSDGKRIIRLGVYYTFIDSNEITENALLEGGFFLFEPQTRTRILIRNKDSIHRVCFDLNSIEFEDSIPNYDDSMVPCRKMWEGIFARVKKEVHGTICVIVNPAWKVEDSQHDEDNRVFLSVNEVKNLQIKNVTDSDSAKVNELNANITTFISMLDYDGVTIIDTLGKIRGYHNFCSEISKNPNSNGGARHNAFNYLIELEQKKPDLVEKFVAVYFQSQEGEILFYKYHQGEEASLKPYNYFKSDIMKDVEIPEDAETDKEIDIEHFKTAGGSDEAKPKVRIFKPTGSSDEAKPKFHIEYTNINQKSADISNFKRLIGNLASAHFGYNNFYSEVVPARVLADNMSDSAFRELICSTPELYNYLIEVCLHCYLGNDFGYSKYSIEYIEKILESIDVKCYEDYFKNGIYNRENGNLFYIMSHDLGHSRFQELVKKLESMKVNMTPDLKEITMTQCFDQYINCELNFEK